MLIKSNFFLVVALLTLSLLVILKISIGDAIGVSERPGIKAKIVDEAARCKDDLSLIKEIILAHDKDQFSNLPHPDDNTILIYKNKQLFFWSDNKVIPDYDVLTGDYSQKDVELRNGKYFAVQSTFAKEANKGNEQDIYNAYILIPLSYKYDIENKYISSGINKKLFPNDPGDQLFGVILLLLGSIALLSFLIYTYLVAQKIAGKWNVEAGFFVLLLIIAALRVLLLYYTLPFSFYEISLFNPKYYASSMLSPSFGDLLINILCVYILLLFLFKNYRRSILLKLLFSAN